MVAVATSISLQPLPSFFLSLESSSPFRVQSIKVGAHTKRPLRLFLFSLWETFKRFVLVVFVIVRVEFSSAFVSLTVSSERGSTFSR